MKKKNNLEDKLYENKNIVIGVMVALIILLLVGFFYFKGRGKTYKISFNANNGTTTIIQSVREGKKVSKPKDPVREGYIFVEWQLNGQPYNFDTPIEENATLVAVWAPISQGTDDEVYYTVMFDSNGGNSVQSQSIKAGELVTKPENPTREATSTTKYTFESWQLDGKDYNFDTPVNSDMTLIAKWKEESIVEKYTVSFNSNGGSAVASQTVEKGQKAKKPTDPTRSGYTFVEWQLNGKAYNFDTQVTSNITLSASWKENGSTTPVEKYTVVFNSNGGSTVSSQTVEKGQKATKPSNPTREGYTFVEWQLNGSAYNFSTPVTSNLTLVAKWNKVVVQKYTVTFNSNGGSSVASQTVESGKTATKPSNPTRSGYTFVEWQLNGNTYNFNTPVTSNITLVAKWNQNVTQNYTVTFNSNGGSSVASQTVEGGRTATKPSNPTKEGYTFVEWQLNGSAYNFSTPVTSNITLDAKWNQKTYTIRAVRIDDFSPYVRLDVYENGTKINVYKLYYTDGEGLNGFSENINSLESAYLVQLSNGGEKFRAQVVN